MKIVMNEVTGVNEFTVPAVLKSINPKIRFTKPTEANPEGARYQTCTVEIEYPNNGGTNTVISTVWAKSVESNQDAFKVGAEVSLTIQADGEFAGRSKVGLPQASLIDLSLFGIGADVAVEEEVEAEA